MEAKKPLLTVRNAHKAYGASEALRGISLELFPGELLALLGPNGAGKTTLVRSILGRTKLDSGDISFWDQTADRVGSVPQRLALYEDLTVEQNLRVFGELHRLEGRTLRDRARESLEWSGLASRRGSLVKTLSGGMKRRLNIACSVLHQPKVLLLDEPTVGVDPQSRERIYEMLCELRSGGAAILLTTHQLSDVQSRCDRIAVVDHGRILCVGDFATLAKRAGVGQTFKVQYRQRPSRPPSMLDMQDGESEGRLSIHDAATQVPSLMRELQRDAHLIESVAMHGRSLQDVFLELTGNSLRE